MGQFQRRFPVCSFILFLMIIWMGLLFNEGESRVRGRIKSYGKIYSKDILKLQISTPVSSEVMESQKKSFCSSVSWSGENCILGPLSIDKDFSPSVFYQLCPHPYGKFKAHIACNLFIFCHNGSLTVNRCPDSEIFNTSTHDCNISSESNSCLESDESVDAQFIINLTRNGTLTTSVGSTEKNTTSLEEYQAQNNTVETKNSTNFPPKSKEDSRFKKAKKYQDILQTFFQPSKTAQNISFSLASRMGESLLERESQYPKEVEVRLCAESGDEIFPHPNSCGHFIQCVHGTEVVKKCAPGTVFNPQTSVCDWETNVPECDGHTDSGNLLVNSNKVRRSVTDSNGIISDVNINRLLSPQGLAKSNNFLFRSTRSIIPSGQRARKCKLSEEYVQPHPIHCNKFEICSNGRIVEETCGRGTLFNPLSLVCDFPDNVDCESRKVDFSTYDCQKDHEYRASHPETCSKFIECDFGSLQIKNCAPGTLYNGEEEKCDYAYKVKCRKPISLEHDTDVNYIPRLGRSLQQNPLNLACEYNYIAPHPRFCNQFVECENGRIFIKSCGPGTVFNGEIGQCDWAYNTKQQDPLDCSQYFQCERGQYTRKSCLQNTIYNPKTKKCVFSQFGTDECKKPTIISAPPPS